MEERERELLDAMVNRVLRHPDEVKDIDALRAVQRLMAARADAPYLLLQRALVLEVALARAHAEVDRLRGAAAVAANDPGLPPDPSAVTADAAARIAAALPSRGSTCSSATHSPASIAARRSRRPT